MKIIKNSSEDEMIAYFLMGEISSNRFGNNLEKTIEKLKYDRKIVDYPNLDNPVENKKRKHILSEFRNYGKNDGLFENFPKINKYVIGEFEAKDLENIRYINYDYWNELSSGTGKPLVASQNIMNGKTVFDVDNTPFFAGANLLQNGVKFKPCIFLTADYNTFIVFEGHSRITCYAMCPNTFNNIQAIVLECSKNDLKKWNS